MIFLASDISSAPLSHSTTSGIDSIESYETNEEPLPEEVAPQGFVEYHHEGVVGQYISDIASQNYFSGDERSGSGDKQSRYIVLLGFVLGFIFAL